MRLVDYYTSSKGVDPLLDNYLLPDVLEWIYDNQLALKAPVMELTSWVEQRASLEVDDNPQTLFDLPTPSRALAGATRLFDVTFGTPS